MSAKCSSEPQLISSGKEDNESEETKWQKIHGVTLTQKDRDIILNGKWLNDNIISTAQCLMKHDHMLLQTNDAVLDMETELGKLHRTWLITTTVYSVYILHTSFAWYTVVCFIRTF